MDLTERPVINEWLSASNNFPTIANQDQTDTNHNGVGDACDPNTKAPR